jgi:hypothetical protein
MPAGYEKIRDSLIAQGKSEEEAKTLAAKIWNKHHKGSEAVGGHYDREHGMSAIDQICELASEITDVTEFAALSDDEFKKRYGLSPDELRFKAGIGVYESPKQANVRGLVTGAIGGAGLVGLGTAAARMLALRKLRGKVGVPQGRYRTSPLGQL